MTFVSVTLDAATVADLAAITDDPIAFSREAIRRAIRREQRKRARAALFKAVGADIADVPGALSDRADGRDRDA
mgnify:CR=1 FL=1